MKPRHAHCLLVKLVCKVPRLLGCGVLSLATGGGCGGPRPATAPEPNYQTPQLPDWEPPARPEEDPLDAALKGGEWVQEPPAQGQPTEAAPPTQKEIPSEVAPPAQEIPSEAAPPTGSPVESGPGDAPASASH